MQAHVCHIYDKKPDKICEIFFCKDHKIKVEVCIISEIRFSGNLGRDVMQFSLLVGFSIT